MTTYKLGDEVRHVKTGAVGILDDINRRPAAERIELNEYWATAEGNYFNSFVIDDPEDIVLVHKKEDIPKKVPPTLAELVGFAQSAMMDEWDGIVIDETDSDGEPEGEFVFSGTSATGAPFSARITISEIEWTDF